ncbi:MAG TPA: hypothetical protein DCS93_31065, partial [Microscillaceae bacterium]|nr:hypothetical protein [Microscillaceae bacterium]
LGYSGQEEDESGLVYYGHRYYQKNGRWNRADPIRFESKQLNLYNLVDGNPVTSRDEMGLLEKVVTRDITTRNKVKLKEFRKALILLDYIHGAHTNRNKLIKQLNTALSINTNKSQKRKMRKKRKGGGDPLLKAFNDYLNGPQDDYVSRQNALPDDYLDELKQKAKQRTFERLQIADGQQNALTDNDWNNVRTYIGEKTTSDEYADLQGLKDAWSSFRGHRARLAANRDVLNLSATDDRNFKQDFQGLMDIALARTRAANRIGGDVARPEFQLRQRSGRNRHDATLRTSTMTLNNQNSDDENNNTNIAINENNVNYQNRTRSRTKAQMINRWKNRYENKIRNSIESGRFAFAWNPAIVDRYKNKLYRYQRSFAHKHGKNSNSWVIGRRDPGSGNYTPENTNIRDLLPDNLVAQMDNEARATGGGSFNMRSVAWVKSGPYDERVDTNLTQNDWQTRRRESHINWHYNAGSDQHTTYYDTAKAAITEEVEAEPDRDANWHKTYAFSYRGGRGIVNRHEGHFGIRRANKAHADERVVTNLINDTIVRAQSNGSAIKSEDISIVSYKYAFNTLKLYTRCPGCHSSTVGVAEHNLYE